MGSGVSGFVYFVRLGAAGPIKIGISTNWQRRVAALQTAHPDRLNVVLVIETETAASLERVLHDQFRAFRRVGEWFDPDASLLSFIECLRAAGADARTPRRQSAWLEPILADARTEREANRQVDRARAQRRMQCCPSCDLQKSALASQWPLEWTQEHSCDGLERFEAMLANGHWIAVEPHGDVWVEDSSGHEVWQTDCFGDAGERDVGRAIEEAIAWAQQRGPA